jgi:site-specific recombinase XerD
VDRGDAMGKRDYAVMMLAAHLGLRSSDIVNLSPDDIDRANKSIDIVQVKTESPVTFVMNADVEEAIDDYMTNGRPLSESRKIFLWSKAPFAPLTPAAVYAIVHKYFNRADISPQGRKIGPHSLRMSYATALVNKGVPYSVVTKALGHEDPESAKHYVRVDMRRLRVCAVDVPKPMGTFAVAIRDLEGRL